MLRDISFYSVCILLFVAMFFYKSYKRFKFYKYFLLYLFFAAFFETLGRFYENSMGIFHIYTFFEFNLIVLIYFYLVKEKKSHIVLYLLTFCFNIFYGMSFVFKELEKYTVPLLGLVVSVFLILYLKELLNSSKILKYQSMLSFWVTSGFLIYYLVSIPFFSVHSVGGFSSRYLFSILYFIILLKNTSFIFGLLWSKKTEV